MNDAQVRVLVEAEFYFYLAGYPELFPISNRDQIEQMVPHMELRDLRRYNAEARMRLRTGSLAVKPLSAVKPIAITPVGPDLRTRHE